MRKIIQINPNQINPNTLLFSDLHLDERKEFNKLDPNTGHNSRFMEGLSILDQIIEYLKTHRNIQYTKFLGDFFKLKDKIPIHMLIELKKRIDEIQYLTDFTILMGNHDFNLPDYPLLDLFGANLITKSKTIVDHHLVSYGYIPFKRDIKEFWEDWKYIHEGDIKPNIVLFHQEMPGVKYNNNKIVPGIVPDSYFSPDILYLSGHIHIHQRSKFVNWIGSPYQVNFNDEGREKFIWLLNPETKQISPMKLKYPEFVTFNINTIDSWQSIEKSITNNYVRIIGEVLAQDWNMEYKRTLKGTLEKLGAKGVSIQVKIIKQRQESSLSKIDIDDDEAIIKTYSETMDISGEMNKERLAQVGLEVFYQN